MSEFHLYFKILKEEEQKKKNKKNKMKTWKVVSGLLAFGLVQTLLFLYLISPGKEIMEDPKIGEVKERARGGHHKEPEEPELSKNGVNYRKLFRAYKETYVPVEDYYVKRK